MPCLLVFATDAGAQQEVSDVAFEGISLDSDNDKWPPWL